jgi:hypothetical protein
MYFILIDNSYPKNMIFIERQLSTYPLYIGQVAMKR